MSEAVSTKNLPDDLESLKQIILEFQDENERLREQLKLMTQRKFGRKSEKTDPSQLQLFDEPDDIEDSLKTEEIATTEIKAHTRVKRNRTLPKDLPRKQIYYDLTEDEKICACGHQLHKLSDDKYEQLDYIPAQITVIEHIKSKYACKCCEDGVRTAKMPKQPIPKSIATAGLLSQVISSKYVDHLPLYRQESIFKRINIEISRATMSNWIFKCAELLEPVVTKLKQHIIESDYSRADETTLNVLSEKENRSKSYMWVFMSGSTAKQSVVFEYQPTRSGEVALEFLEGFHGYLQTDGYTGYNKLREKNTIIALGCWAHARRKFFEITKINKKSASAHKAVEYIDKLYKIERNAKLLNLEPDKIKEVRCKKSTLILDNFKKWLDKTAPRVPPKSALGNAIGYTLNQWDTLITYCLDGRLDIDNNAVERMIKPFACGRKNWLFQGNTRGAKASAILYSLVQTCKVNDIDPYKYLRYVLEQIPSFKPVEDLTALLPFNCKF